MTNGDYTLGSDVLAITVDYRRLEFHRTNLAFLDQGCVNVFAQKNNKTVEQTLRHRRYAKLSTIIARRYPSSMHEPLGQFLLMLKCSGDLLYKRFLNPYGDGVYCRFRMDRGSLSLKKGLYCYCVSNDLRYIGRSIDSFEKRINQGYGVIHPKNCFLDGQATNCHLNALIAESVFAVSLFVFPMSYDLEIVRLEQQLIQILQPPWNIALTR